MVLYRVAPPDQIGVASGLSKTALQMGAVAASALIGLTFGATPTDAGLHRIAWQIVVGAVLALVLTVADRSLVDEANHPGAQ